VTAFLNGSCAVAKILVDREYATKASHGDVIVNPDYDHDNDDNAFADAFPATTGNRVRDGSGLTIFHIVQIVHSDYHEEAVYVFKKLADAAITQGQLLVDVDGNTPAFGHLADVTYRKKTTAARRR